MLKVHFNFKPFLLTLAIFTLLLSLFLTYNTKAQAALGINRTINFQGKLVNNPSGTNVTNTSYTVIFTIYDNPSGGTALWTETQTITTADGIFRASLGSVTPIPANFNFNWSDLYLGIKVNADSEMTPRVKLAAVPFAFNAERVSGLTVQDDSGNASTSGTLRVANSKTVTFAGSNGLTFNDPGGSTTITFPATGSLTLVDTATGQTLTNKIIGSTGLTFTGAATDITTGTNEAFVIAPNGSGFIGINTTTPLASFDIRNNGVLGGTVSIASVSGRTSFAAIVANNDLVAGDLFTASSSSQSRFTIKGNGQIIANTYQTCTLKTDSTGLVTCGTDNTGGSGSSPFAEITGGVIVPNNSTVDFLVGGQSTTSAKFAFINIAGARGTQTASLSGSLTLDSTTASIQSVKNQLLAIGGNTTGDIQFKPGNSSTGLYLQSTGNVGVGTTAPSVKLHVASSADAIGILNEATDTGYTAIRSKNSAYAGYDYGIAGGGAAVPNAFYIFDVAQSAMRFSVNPTTGNISVGGMFTANAPLSFGTGVQTNKLYLYDNTSDKYGFGVAANTLQIYTGAVAGANATIQFGKYDGTTLTEFARILDGRFGIGTTSPVAPLHINSGYGSNASLIVNNLNSGDLITASSSGVTKFRLDTSGNASMSGSLTMVGSNSIQTTAFNSLTLGGATTGQVVLSGFNGAVNGITFAGYTTAGCTLKTTTSGVVQCGTDLQGSGTGFESPFRELTGSIIPLNSINDFLVGGQSTNSAKFRVTGASPFAGTLGVASVSGTTSFAALVTNNDGVGDLFAASSSSQARFSIKGNGQIIANAYQTCTLKTDSTGLVTCGTDLQGGASTELWGSALGLLYTGNQTLDFAVGGSTTSSAKFAVTGVASNTPVATLSAVTNGNGLVFSGNSSTIQALRNNALTLGGNTTGDINLRPGTGMVFIGENEVRNGGLTFYSSGVGETDPTITVDATGNLILTASTGTVELGSGTGNVQLEGDADTSIVMSFAGVPAADMVQITNTGQAATATGVDGLALTYVLGGSSAVTNAGITVDLTTTNNNASTVLRGINIGNITGQAAASEVGLRIGTGWDTGISVESGGITITSGNLDVNSNIITNIGSAGTDFDTSGGLNITTDAVGTALTVDNAANASSIFVAEDNNLPVFTIVDGGDITWAAATPTITINAAETFTISNGTAADNFVYNTSTNALTLGDGTNGLTFDIDTGMAYQGTGRKVKKITLSAEYAGAVLTASGSATTNGSMTSDASPSGALSNYMNYYEWTSSQTSLQDYTIAVRVHLPEDFSAWATSTAAAQIKFNTETSINSAINKLDVMIYNTDNALSASDQVTPVVFKGENTSLSKNWKDIDILSTQLDSGAARDIDAAGEVMVIYLKMSSKDNNHVQVGNIVLSYLSAF